MKLLDDNFRKAVAEKVVAGLEDFVKMYAAKGEKAPQHFKSGACGRSAPALGLPVNTCAKALDELNLGAG